MRVLAATLSLVLGLFSVSSGEPTRSSDVPLVEISAAQLAQCERSGFLRPACPRLVPRVPAYVSSLSVEQAGEAAVLDVFSLEHSGEDQRNPERNRPPRMAHVVAAGGDVERLAPFREPRGRTSTTLRNGLMRRDRARPVSFGPVQWGGRTGILYLAPAWPRGGMLGNHLVFPWREHRRRYSLSLHAWEPLTESAATLRAMALALPSAVAAKRLIRLSPVHRLTMPQGARIARLDVVAPSPNPRAFDVYAVASGRADIGIRIEASDGDRITLVDSTRSCSLRIPLRICVVRVPREIAPRGGRWAIVLTKRSDAPARARVDLRFR